MTADGPFRAKPWPLNIVRYLLRRLRLWRVRLFGRFQFVYGDDVSLSWDVDIRPPHRIELGSRVSIGKSFTCEVDLTVGSDVLISSNVAIVGKDHPFDDPQHTVYSHPRTDQTLVEIGSNVLVGYGTIVVGSVRIGDGCIIGAGSVVTKDLPAYMVCAGVPARELRKRFVGDAVAPTSVPM